ncbi:MAG TPA: TPM domain-containing protein, partial [Gemmatimonadales bacterium]|nr:TPM domain-containing protein [Gemmatimonadales bacterium]
MLLQLVPALLFAQTAQIQRLFPPKPDNYLTDVARVVDPASAGAINDLASRLRSATGAELAVVTLPTINDRAPGDVALTIGRTWGVGAKGAIGDSTRNAGMVLLLVPRTAEHGGQIFLSTGRGIEGIITDATAGRITDLMLPELRQGHYGPALLLGTRAIAATVARGFGVTDSALIAANPFEQRAPAEQGHLPTPVVVLIIVVLVILLFAAGSRGGRGGGGGSGGGWRRRGLPLIWLGGSGWGGG